MVRMVSVDLRATKGRFVRRSVEVRGKGEQMALAPTRLFSISMDHFKRYFVSVKKEQLDSGYSVTGRGRKLVVLLGGVRLYRLVHVCSWFFFLGFGGGVAI